MKKQKFLLAPVALIVLWLLPATAQADPLLLTLNSFGTGGANSILAFQGTLTNGGSPAVFLNSISITGLAPGIVGDSLPFFSNTPASLGPNLSTGLITIFSVKIGLVPEGLYNGSITILGGPTETSINSLVTKDFQVKVVPEPATLFLLGTGLAGSITAIRRRRRKASV